jgi:hypothetical protein
VPHQAVTAVGELVIGTAREEGVRFRLDRLREKAARAGAQDGGQRIVDLIRLTQGNNGAIATHGVSLLREVRAGWLPASIRRSPQTVITHFPA